jgi:hypothetical protein
VYTLRQVDPELIEGHRTGAIAPRIQGYEIGPRGACGNDVAFAPDDLEPLARLWRAHKSWMFSVATDVPPFEYGTM